MNEFPLKSVIAVIAVIIFFLMFGSFYTIDQGARGVILRNGAISGTAEPGLAFKMPFIDNVKEISVQSQAQSYTDIASYSKDQQTAHLNVSVNYRIPADQVTVVYENYGGQEGLTSRLLDRQVLEEIKTVFGRFNAASAIQERERLNTEVQMAIQKAVHGPILVESVQIENIDFSNAYENSIEERMLAEVEVQKVRQNAEKEKVSAEIAVIKAQAEADARVAQAKATAEATRLAGDAEAAAIRAKGDALAKNPALVALISAEKWDGALPTQMLPGSTVPFLNLTKAD